MRRLAARLPAVLATAAVALALPAQAALALDYERTSRERVIDALVHETFRVRLGDGKTARGNLLRFDPAHPHLSLRPALARNRIAGLETMGPLARRELDRGAAAGTNGGYWLSTPTGAPNGLYVEGGRALAGEARLRVSGNRRARSSVGVGPDGTVLMDLLKVDLTLAGPDGAEVRVDDLNRHLVVGTADDADGSDGSMVVYDHRYGAPVEIPKGAVFLVVDRLDPPAHGAASGAVRQVGQATATTTRAVEPGTSLIVAHGDARPRAEQVLPGPVTLTVRLRPTATAAEAWAPVTQALPGGPLLARDGRSTAFADWQREAFSDSHLTGRHARTVIARTSGGEVLLATVDRGSHSAGMTLREVRDLLLGLGASEVLNLDGGGSTTMTVGGQTHNRPSQSDRSVANGLFVYVAPGPPARDPSVHACPPERTPPAGFDDAAATPFAAVIDCVAWYELTTGVGDDQYAPYRNVTRAQMASFVARWVDRLAEHGSGNALPPPGEATFPDVTGGAHRDDIERLAAAGIVQGGTDGRYRPSADVTRAQMASFVARAHAHASGAALTVGRDLFIDDNRSSHEPDINRLANAGIVQGRARLRYAPQRVVSRAEMAAFLARLSDRAVADGRIAPPDTW